MPILYQLVHQKLGVTVLVFQAIVPQSAITRQEEIKSLNFSLWSRYLGAEEKRCMTSQLTDQYKRVLSNK